MLSMIGFKSHYQSGFIQKTKKSRHREKGPRLEDGQDRQWGMAPRGSGEDEGVF